MILRLLLPLCLLVAPARADTLPEAAAVDEVVEAVLEKHDVPAVGIAVASVTGETVVSVRGVREVDGELAEPDDAWHLGSCTKAITSLLAARLVEQGVVTWETTPADVFDNLPAAAKKQTLNAPLYRLLSHTSGLPGRGADALVLPIAAIRAEGGDAPRRQRRGVADAVMCLEPAADPGVAFGYCNGGYILASAMLEAAANAPLELLFETHVFEPLGITSAGWGPPDHIRGHNSAGPSIGDNPKAYDAAGRLHLSLADWATICRVFLGDPDDFVTEGSRQRLLKPVHAKDPAYALGWLEIDSAVLGQAYAHDGTNTLWLTMAMLLPERGTIVVIAMNRHDAEAMNAARDAVAGLVVEASARPATDR